ncbi:MAG TPA: polyprenyl synthetase family protein [Candidatus Baltobacteraceae bacterium]|jgi:geranylgeranyl pyrophosphate synthase|nr:polyprenyl synthetase family protein [Candidatus Baltobacteraceae bacterium]
MIDAIRSDEANLYALVESFFRETFSTDNEIITEAVKRMLAAGGKRLRPRFTLLGAAACGGDAVEHLQLAAYMELIHVATLIHDDVVDNAQTRRGVNATAIDYGNRVSVLAGDYLFAWIFKNVTANYPHPVPNILSSTLADICDGEVLQLRAMGDLDLRVEAYIEVANKKTASLFAASAECGAIMGGGSAHEIAALRRFGDLYGVAFQMKDDLLDVSADERTIGKPVGNDLTERKMTIPLILALARGSAAFREEVARFYRGTSNENIAHVVAGIAREGGIAATNTEIRGFIERAIAALEPIRPSAAKDELAKLARALLAE